MQSNLLPYPTDEGNFSVQLAMRPVQLWEVVFPKQSLPNVLKAINYTPDTRPEMKKPLWGFRKLLQAQKIPELDLSKTIPVMSHMDNVAVYPVGIREDKAVWKEGQFKGAEVL